MIPLSSVKLQGLIRDIVEVLVSLSVCFSDSRAAMPRDGSENHWAGGIWVCLEVEVLESSYSLPQGAGSQHGPPRRQGTRGQGSSQTCMASVERGTLTQRRAVWRENVWGSRKDAASRTCSGRGLSPGCYQACALDDWTGHDPILRQALGKEGQAESPGEHCRLLWMPVQYWLLVASEPALFSHSVKDEESSYVQFPSLHYK